MGMIGFLTVLLAAFFFCFQNVIVRVLFNQQTVLGLGQIGGFVTPSLSHSFLLMVMRMLLVVPLMAGLATHLYPPTWQEISQLRLPNQRSLAWQAIACGGLMWLYLALLYVSIGLIPTGIALTLFFTYPAFTALFSWRWLGDRPTLLRWIVMLSVFTGSALTMLPIGTASHNLVGIITGLLSGVAYALYTVIAQKSFTVMHPVPFTWLSFAVSLLLSGLSCTLTSQPGEVLPWIPLWIGALGSAIVTLIGHLLNNIGISLIGASSAAIVAASNPALTVVLAWVTIQERLQGLQLLGVAIVTFSVALLSREHTKRPE